MESTDMWTKAGSWATTGLGKSDSGIDKHFPINNKDSTFQVCKIKKVVRKVKTKYISIQNGAMLSSETNA